MSDPTGDARDHSHSSVEEAVVMSVADYTSADMVRGNAARSGRRYAEEMSAAI